jgi:hypothetical protein
MALQRDPLFDKVDRVKKSIQQFPEAASKLNAATDQLGKSVGQLDAVLKKFSLGVPTWVSFKLESDENLDYYYKEELGYAKIGGKWGVAIRTVEYNPGRRDNDIEQWLFNEAPRLLRVQAIEKIPELLQAMLEAAGVMSKQIAEKAEELDVLTAGISEVIDRPSKSINLAGLSPVSAADPSIVAVAEYAKRTNEEVAAQIAAGRYRGGLAGSKARK